MFTCDLTLMPDVVIGLLLHHIHLFFIYGYFGYACYKHHMLPAVFMKKVAERFNFISKYSILFYIL